MSLLGIMLSLHGTLVSLHGAMVSLHGDLVLQRHGELLLCHGDACIYLQQHYRQGNHIQYVPVSETTVHDNSTSSRVATNATIVFAAALEAG